MKEIDNGIYIEDAYPGVTLGALVMKRGTLLIDAPPHPGDGHSWLTFLRSKGSKSDRVLILLDSHTDRSLGTQAMDSAVLAHEKTVAVFKGRSAIFKAQVINSGAEWETCSGLSGIRWAHPNMLFSQHAQLPWGDFEVIIEHHPGPEPGASWVILPEQKIVFVGDAVLVKQPPFLENADIPTWINTLNMLLSKPYRDFSIISSRGGPVAIQAIRDQRKFLKSIQKRIERLAKRIPSPETTEKLSTSMLSNFSFPTRLKTMYFQRLAYGLFQYTTRHYFPETLSKKK
ncbi:MAG: hypothetical protein FVQ83_02790 [Chloroflexi bacterium]|nr:hypothetical protein [Chloroflexota bacterium]